MIRDRGALAVSSTASTLARGGEGPRSDETGGVPRAAGVDFESLRLLYLAR